MKRLLVVASLAIMAIGCQKTEVNNLVTNEIGFNTETGKMTRAGVMTDATYDTEVNFAVYSYGYQVEEKTVDGVTKEVKVENSTSSPMQNVLINAKTGKASQGSYYWPNDADTRLDFYAYSPFLENMSHNPEDGFTVEYTQANPYTDFMVATPVIGAIHGDQDGVATPNSKPAKVPVVFNHKLTQVVFNVKSGVQGAITTVNNITLKGIGSVAVYTENDEKPWAAPDSESSIDYEIFSNEVAAAEGSVNGTTATNVTTVPVALIPQDLEGLTFDIEYSIEGEEESNGIAKETVNLTGVKLAVGDLTEWAPNQKVTYNLTISLREIVFNTPTVNDWTPNTNAPITIQ